MPRKDIDYSKTMMYKIVSNDLNINDCYVGSTTEFTKRKSNHKSDCTNANGKRYNFKVYKFIRDNGDWQNWSMILIEMYPCTNHLESLQRERYWCEHLNATLNSLVPSRSPKEYTFDHKEHKKQYLELYRENHKEQIKKKSTQYNVANKEHIRTQQKTVIYCECGSLYTRCNKLRHERSEKHTEYEKNRLYYDIRRGLNMIKALDKHFCNQIK
jgi:hypothetical protein